MPDKSGSTFTKIKNVKFDADTRVDRDVIDHKSLADYFSAPQQERGVSEPSATYSIQMNGQQDKNDYGNADRQLVDLSKTSNNRISRLVLASHKKVLSVAVYTIEAITQFFSEKLKCVLIIAHSKWSFG